MGIKRTGFIMVLLAWPSLISAFNPETHANTSLQEPPSNIHPNVVKELISIRDRVTHLLDTIHSDTKLKPTSDVAEVKLEDSAELVARDNLAKITTEGREFDPLSACEDDDSEANQLENHAYADTNTPAPSTTTTPASLSSPLPPCPPPSHEPTDIPTVYSRLTAGVSAGFLIVTMKNSIDIWTYLVYHLSPLQGLSVTIIFAGSYYYGVYNAPFWDSLLELDDPKLVQLAGAVLRVLGLVVGPLLPFHKTVTTLAIGIVLHSAGLDASESGGLPDAALSNFVFCFGWTVGWAVGGRLDRARAILLILLMEVVNIAFIFCY